jgi:uncharacterized protein (TIGR02598 family)
MLPLPYRPTCGGRSGGFTLIEIAVALGIVAFALMSILALLPMGAKNNQISAEEPRAADILSVAQADLRNTSPLANGKKTLVYQLQSPYDVDTTTHRVKFNEAVTTVTDVSTAVSAGCTAVVDRNEKVQTDDGVTRYPYQVSVIYIQKAGATTPNGPLEARIVVNWPSVTSAKISDLTNVAKVRGFVQAYVTFPSP